MDRPSIRQNLVTVEPTMKDMLDMMKKDINLSLNCHHIGQIEEFDKDQQVARVSIMYKKTYFDRNPKTKQYESKLVDYPILLDVPVVFLGGGKGSLTFPVTKGDECLLLFNDRDIDNWFSSGQVAPVATPRLHSISDAFAIVGIRSLNKVLGDFDDGRTVLQQDAAKVAVGDTKIEIANAQHTLNGLLQDLVTAINDLVSATAAITVTGVTPGPGVSGVPANAATITAVSTDLTTIATEIGELLE